jgi:hypothetical protein
MASADPLISHPQDSLWDKAGVMENTISHFSKFPVTGRIIKLRSCGTPR